MADPTQYQMSCQAINVEEFRILKVLDARIHLVSPPKWANAVLCRLAALGGISQAPAAKCAWPVIRHWSRNITEQIPATHQLPPRALGVAACVLGLMSIEAIEAATVHRSPVEHPEASGGPQALCKPFSFNSLALAACCSEYDVRMWAFKVPMILANAALGLHSNPIHRNLPVELVDSPFHSTLRPPMVLAPPSHTQREGLEPSPTLMPPSLGKPQSIEASLSANSKGTLMTQVPVTIAGNQSEHTPKSSLSQFTILVASFPRSTLPEMLLELFRFCGTPVSAEVAVDKCGISRCYGFVRFTTSEAQKAAIVACESKLCIMEDEWQVQWHLKAEVARRELSETMPASPDRSIFARAKDLPSKMVPKSCNPCGKRAPLLKLIEP
jgi:hypothetical protein